MLGYAVIAVVQTRRSHQSYRRSSLKVHSAFHVFSCASKPAPSYHDAWSARSQRKITKEASKGARLSPLIQDLVNRMERKCFRVCEQREINHTSPPLPRTLPPNRDRPLASKPFAPAPALLPKTPAFFMNSLPFCCTCC